MVLRGMDPHSLLPLLLVLTLGSTDAETTKICSTDICNGRTVCDSGFKVNADGCAECQCRNDSIFTCKGQPGSTAECKNDCSACSTPHLTYQNYTRELVKSSRGICCRVGSSVCAYGCFKNYIEPCLSFPCPHGSTCENVSDGGYKCLCAPGYTGNRCTWKIGQTLAPGQTTTPPAPKGSNNKCIALNDYQDRVCVENLNTRDKDRSVRVVCKDGYKFEDNKTFRYLHCRNDLVWNPSQICTAVRSLSTWHPLFDSLYMVNPEPLSWSKADAHCKSLSARLVSINSAEENAFVLRLALHDLQDEPLLHIGLRSDPGWSRWLDGTDVTFDGFAPGRPYSSNHSAAHGLLNCGGLHLAGDKKGEWFDWLCEGNTALKPSVCEKPKPAGEVRCPSLIDPHACLSTTDTRGTATVRKLCVNGYIMKVETGRKTYQVVICKNGQWMQKQPPDCEPDK